MPALRPLLAASVLLATLSGCGGKKSDETTTPAPADAGSADAATATPTAEAAAKGPVGGYIAGLDTIAVALESVKDEASAKTAAVAITEVTNRMQALTAEMDKMPKMERGMAFAAAMQEMSRVQMRIATAMQPLITKPELMKQLGDAMKSIPKVK